MIIQRNKVPPPEPPIDSRHKPDLLEELEHLLAAYSKHVNWEFAGSTDPNPDITAPPAYRARAAIAKAKSELSLEELIASDISRNLDAASDNNPNFIKGCGMDMDRLVAQRDRLTDSLLAWLGRSITMENEIESLKAENEALRKNAEK